MIREAKLVKDPENMVDVTNDGDFRQLLHHNSLFTKSETNLYDNTYRYGIAMRDVISTAKEFLFFTKPDLHICQMDENNKNVSERLNEDLAGNLFWTDLFAYRKPTIRCLQDSYGLTRSKDRFNHLLQNTCISNLEVPALTSEMIETPTNIYGVGFSYRGSSEDSDDGPEFSLEFKDNRWLDVYYYFKTYEEYETLKHHGSVAPWQGYTIDKIVHDAFSIYKFIVDEDMETILYYGKMYGVTPTTLPRDVFSNPTFDNGITYSITFKAAFYEDMKIDILSDFNDLSMPFYEVQPYTIDIYNKSANMVDGRPARAAIVTMERSSRSSTGYVYKLKWKGGEKY